MDRAIDHWAARLPAALLPHVVVPLRVEAHHDDGVPASKWRGYDAEAGLHTPLACTRKTWPGGRAVARRAVLAGGAVMHRLGLSETLLVFPEHRALMPAGDRLARLATLRRAQPEKEAGGGNRRRRRGDGAGPCRCRRRAAARALQPDCLGCPARTTARRRTGRVAGACGRREGRQRGGLCTGRGRPAGQLGPVPRGAA